MKRIKIPFGFFENQSDIVKWMNYQDFNGLIQITYNKHTRKVKIGLKPTARIKLLPELAETLGFISGEFINSEEPLRDSPYKYFEGINIADPNFDLKLLYIYSDIAESQIVGRIVSPLLRVITVKGKDGDMIHEVFDRPHYVPFRGKAFKQLKLLYEHALVD